MTGSTNPRVRNKGIPQMRYPMTLAREYKGHLFKYTYNGGGHAVSLSECLKRRHCIQSEFSRRK